MATQVFVFAPWISAGRKALAALVLAVLAGGCAMESPSPGEALDAAASPLRDSNGLTPNGLATNGLATNGLATNGLATNGLATNGLAAVGLASASFNAWFNANPAEYSDMVMRYLVTCAYARGLLVTYRNPATGSTYAWTGGLGLAPGWASGLPISQDEQQLITACLAAHVNKFGIHMPLSVRGTDALGLPIPVSPDEDIDFKRREAAFFGNLFTGEGVYVCNDSATLNTKESSARACGLSSQASGLSKECPPIVHVGGCPSICTWDRGKGYHTACTFNGKSYKPLSTRIRDADVYQCGDGTCQVSESCDSTSGRGTSYDSCQADCGQCPP